MELRLINTIPKEESLPELLPNQLQWIDESIVYDYYSTDDSSLFYFKKVMEIFFKKYPTPLDWLNDSTKEKIKPGNSNTTNELIYILFWISEIDTKDILGYEEIILNYLKSKMRSPYFLQMANYKGFLTDNDIAKILSINKSISIRAIALMCIYLKKSFYDITEDDLKIAYKYNILNEYSIGKVRMKLGISNVVKKVNRKSKNWDYLCSHEKFGGVFTEFKNIITVRVEKNGYLVKTGKGLKYLLEFMDENKYEDFSVFDSPSMFEYFIEWLEDLTSPKTVRGYIPPIRYFFKINENREYFPPKLNFCTQYWSTYSRLAKKLCSNSDGLAFSDADLATKIVMLLLEYEPKDDIEFLCKQFWLLIVSCPARYKYVLSLEAFESLRPLPNITKESYGLYSRFHDKAGNKYGQSPILDKLGVNALKALQERAKRLNLKPIYNPENKSEYVHLFQLTDNPWILNRNHTDKFYNDNIMSKIKENSDNPEEIRATAHSFRHYIATHIAVVSKNIEACQTALLHKNITMTEQYLRSKASRDTTLFKIVDKFKQNEITGKFYLKLVQLLTSNDTTTDELIQALTTEMKLDEFFQKYGRKIDFGYCFSKEGCSNWYACWSCSNFIITKNEINEAIKILAIQILELKNLQQCIDFSFEAKSVKNKMDLISLIIKRLTELGLTEEDIDKMVHNCFENKDLLSGVAK